MGLNIRLEEEDGSVVEQIEDPRGDLNRLLVAVADGSPICLQYIDLYGDTVFNRLQMKPFLREWAGLKARAVERPQAHLVTEVERLARTVEDDVHLYLRFVGD